MASLACLEQEVVEPIEGGRRRLARVDEAIPAATGRRAGVVANHDDAVALGPADPLAGRLRDGVEGGRLVHHGSQREGHAMAGRLDLLDRREPAGDDGGAEPLVGGRDFRIGGDDIDPVGGEPRRQGDQSPAMGLRHGAHRDRTARQVGAATPDEPPRADQGERATPVIGDEEARLPAARPSVLGPGTGLVDVAAGRLDGDRIPIDEFSRQRVADLQSAAP